jgi:hypothetical protein
MLNRPERYLHVIPAFVLGFALGGVSIHYAADQGVFGMASVNQIGSALVDMQKNVDDLQKNMGTLKTAKEQLAALPAEGGREMLKKAIPGMGP